MVDDGLRGGEARAMVDVRGKDRSRTMRGVIWVWDLAPAARPEEGGWRKRIAMGGIIGSWCGGGIYS